MSSWKQVVATLTHKEDSSTYAVVADMIMNECDEQEMARMIGEKNEEIGNHFYFIPFYNKPSTAEEKASYAEYKALCLELDVLLSLGKHLFAPCPHCNGCYAEPGYYCRMCVQGLDITRQGKAVGMCKDVI